MTPRRSFDDKLSGMDTAADPSGEEPGGEEPGGRFAQAALERHKREGMDLAFRARLLALAVIAVLILLTSSFRTALFYEALIILLALVGWLQRRVARVGRSTAETALIFADILIMTIAIAVPNPFMAADMPVPMVLRAEAFKFFYVILAFATLAYSWRTVRGIGTMTAISWVGALTLIWLASTPDPELAAAAEAAFGHSPVMLDFLDPNSFLLWIRIQEVVVFIIVAWVLGTTVQRFSGLLMREARLERERTNLARYFSPNVVEELSNNDEPLKSIRMQNVAVLFVDIVGFTRFAADRQPQEVIETLRAFHTRMEAEVFRHRGTLDKFLGDGLMATFGTPAAGRTDARNALTCARAMSDSVTAWNVERAEKGEPPLQVGIGLHYGPVVLGDIGANRLEFAVIGDTVNVASRVENLTRTLGVRIAATDAAVARARAESAEGDDPAQELTPLGTHPIRGQERALGLWGC